MHSHKPDRGEFPYFIDKLTILKTIKGKRAGFSIKAAGTAFIKIRIAASL
jgi:hypothetical protein